MILLLLGIVFAGCAFWHVRENQQLARKWRGDLDTDSAERLVRFAWARTAQLLFVLACASVVILSYHSQLSETREVPEAINKPAAAPQKPPPKAAAKPQFPTPQVHPVAAPPKPAVPVAAPVAAPVKESYYPPLSAQPLPVIATPMPVAPPVQVVAPVVAANKVAVPAPPMANTQKPVPVPEDETQEEHSAIGAIGSPYDPPQTVDDVYNPEKKAGDNESAMDGIKKRYEDILVTYMFLKRCNKAGESDYPIIISALGQEMASVNAPGRMQYDIINSAKGSYEEMYAKSSCDNADTLLAQYTDYIKGLSKNIGAP